MAPNSCLLKCERTGVCISLQPGKQIIGRSRETKIKDLRCSKKQVECEVKPSAGLLVVRVLGANPSAANGQDLQRGETASLQHGDTLQLLSGEHGFSVVFDSGGKRSANDADLAEDTPAATRPRLVEKEEDVDVSETTEESWTSAEKDALYVFMTKGVKPSSKIAAFDLDGTIITTKSGKVFAKDKDDWQILYPAVPGTLKQLVRDGYKIVLLTNQLGIIKRKLEPADLRQKLRNVSARLGVPLQCLVSPADGMFRKPRTGMWDYLCRKGNGGVRVNVAESFYCGDAAGRLDKWTGKRKKDFSCSDRLFALNVDISFCTPEEKFLGDPATKKYQLPEFNPRAAVAAAKLAPPPDVASQTPEVLVLVGPPGSGKSHVTARHLQPAGYVAANRDTLKSWQKCVQVVENAIKDGRSAVVDNTNGDKESRKRYTEVARRLSVPARCLLMATPLAQAKHNNKFRELTEPSHQHITEMVFNMYKSRYQEPSLEEGFSSIQRLDCTPVFRDPEREQLYSMYLLEK